MVAAAAGHETYQFRTLATFMRDTLEVRCLVLSAPRPLVYAAGRVIGLFVGDVVLTRDEIAGLSGGLCVSDSPTRRQRLWWSRSSMTSCGRRVRCW